MDIKKVAVSKINPAPYNPRKDLKPDDVEYKHLAKSLETFGCVEPLVWNKRTGNLVGGHQRLKVLLAKGVKEVEVSVVDLPPKKEKALNIALNKELSPIFIAGDVFIPPTLLKWAKVGGFETGKNQKQKKR